METIINIKIICVGKIKEKYFTDGILEYKKRLSAFCNVQEIEVKEVNTNDFSKNIELEGENILEVIKPTDYVVALAILGKQLDSIEFSKKIEEHYTYSSSVITFVIGGSNGLSDKVLARSNYKLSFGKVTYPHQLMRLILFEQIYRAMMIINNHKYHK